MKNYIIKVGENILHPVTKANTISFAISTTIMLYISNYLNSMNTKLWIINILITMVASTTFYKLLYRLIFYFCKKSRILKEFILGSYYFEGLWIGYCYDQNGIEYYYESFEQTLEGLVIKGHGFNQHKEFVSDWTIINPNINISESKFTYYYELNEVNNDDIVLGYSRSTIVWDTHNHAYRLEGFAFDRLSNNKQVFISRRIKSLKNSNDYNMWIKNNFWKDVYELANKEIFEYKCYYVSLIILNYPL